MSYISPRSLQLLQDIVNEDPNQQYEDLYVEETAQHTAADNSRRIENMNVSDQQDFKENLNFFEKLQKENGSVTQNGNVLVNGYINGDAPNGIEEDKFQGTEEESEEDTFTVTEVSETTADTSNLDSENSSNKVFKKVNLSKKVITRNRDQNHNYKPAKASSLRDNSTDRDSVNDQGETMSDSGHVGGRRRKLNKRAQFREFRSIGIEPLETAEEKLEKKYEELEELISGQFVEQKRALSINHLQQMELLRQQYAIASHGLPPSGVLIPRSMPAKYRQGLHQRQTSGGKENVQHPSCQDDAYTAIRTLQASRVTNRRSRARSARTRPLSATRQNQSRSASREGRDRIPEKHPRHHSDDRNNERSRRGTKARSRSNSGSRSSSGSPRRAFIPTETHLKNTENELVLDWIKKKDAAYRKKRAEERKKKRLERQEKIEKRIEREEKYKDSKKLVQQWMRQKNKEAYLQKRREKVEQKEEAARKAQERAKQVEGIHGWGADRPLSAPAPLRTDKSKIRVSRPGTTVEEVKALEEQRARGAGLEKEEGSGQQEVPQPPGTKYVYRRPVLGKVRLRIKQEQKQEEPKAANVKKVAEKPLTKEEIEKKQRISYDDWLQQKRKEDVEKKKEIERQKEIAQSQPEFEVQAPDLVQNGEHNVLQGKGIQGMSGKSANKPLYFNREDRNKMRGASCGVNDRPQYVSRVISQEERERIREMAKQKKQLQGSLEEEVDTSYDERSESPEEAIQRVAKNIVSYVLRSVSDEETEDEDGLFEDNDESEHEGLSNLIVLGSKTSLTGKTRPMSASAVRIPGPQSSKSPRRPVSAQPKPKPVSREAIQGNLPFPPEIGAPPHVQRIQKKLFPDKMWVNSVGDERPEPQGSDSSENRVMVETHFHSPVEKMESQLEDSICLPLENGESNGESLMSSKKHVSFCEETTVFDEGESEVDEELEEWQDEDPLQDASDLEKARKLFLDADANLENSTPSVGVYLTTDVQSNVETES